MFIVPIRSRVTLEGETEEHFSADHAVERIVLCHDRKELDLMDRHEADCIIEGRLLIDNDQVFFHDLPGRFLACLLEDIPMFLAHCSKSEPPCNAVPDAYTVAREQAQQIPVENHAHFF